MSKYIKSLMQLSAASLVMMSAVSAEQTNQNQNAPMCQMPQGVCCNYPMLNNGYGVHMDVGYLLEQFVLTGTDFGFTTEGAYNDLPMSAKVLRPKFNVASGVTAELGMYFEHDSWFWNTKFDWVSRKGRKSWAIEDATDTFVPTGIWTNVSSGNGLIGGSAANYFTEAKNSLRVSYYMLQTELNRGLYVTKTVAFEPHAGLRAAWIYYKGKTCLEGGSDALDLGVERSQSTKFWGLGPDFGLNTQWNFGCGFSMFLDSTMALLCGGANVKDTVEYNESTVFSTYARENAIVMSPAVSGLFGFQYNSGMFDDSQNFRIRIGVDSSYYWNQFQHMNVVSNPTSGVFQFLDNGGFGMIGMRVDLGWDF